MIKCINPQNVITLEVLDKKVSNVWKLAIKKGEYEKLFGFIKLYKSNNDYYCDGDSYFTEEELVKKYDNIIVENHNVYLKACVKFKLINNNIETLWFDSYDEALDYYNKYIKNFMINK